MDLLMNFGGLFLVNLIVGRAFYVELLSDCYFFGLFYIIVVFVTEVTASSRF